MTPQARFEADLTTDMQLLQQQIVALTARVGTIEHAVLRLSVRKLSAVDAQFSSIVASGLVDEARNRARQDAKLAEAIAGLSVAQPAASARSRCAALAQGCLARLTRGFTPRSVGFASRRLE